MGKKSKNPRKRDKTNQTKSYGSHQVVSVFDPDDKLGFLYTVGLHERGRSEFAALNVPKKEIKAICQLMNFLAPRDVKDNQTVESFGHEAITKQVSGQERLDLLCNNMCQCHPEAEVTLLIPRFRHWPPLPRAPKGKQVLAEKMLSILRKSSPIRHVDGNTLNNAFTNLELVSVPDALMHPEWTTDLLRLEEDVTEEEYDFVFSNVPYFLKVLANKCGNCGKRENLELCEKCEAVACTF